MSQIRTPRKERCKIVAVDGPAGSGKSSICLAVCKNLGWTYVNTGFLYRAIAYICRQRDLDLTHDESLKSVIVEFTLELKWQPETGQVIFNGEDLSPYLYTDTAGQDASYVAKNPIVRDLLLPLQRSLALLSPVGAIVDGRDIGTVVFPDADLKVFMTASLEERARRRLLQLNNGDLSKVSENELQELKSSIAQRDNQDEARGASPLKQADDAIILDTSDLDVEGVKTKLMDLIRGRVLA